MSITAPSRREEFEIAIICVTDAEYDAVCLVFDQFWDDDGERYGRAVGDYNTYATGRIGKFNVVLARLQNMGKVNAASAAASVRSSYSCLQLALLVGICGGVPRVDLSSTAGPEILLGDVVISERVVQYDFDRMYPDGFVEKNTVKDNLPRPNKNIANLLASFKNHRGLKLLKKTVAELLMELQAKAQEEECREEYGYPGAAKDRLFKPNYRHKHQTACKNCEGAAGKFCEEAAESSCEKLGCEEAFLEHRKLLQQKRNTGDNDKTQQPMIHLGVIASGDQVMKSGEDRDFIAGKTGAIAFEMEGAGVWEDVPCIVIKGVCDYADSHKNKMWQPFAAATAASTAKALLQRYPKTDRVLPTPAQLLNGAASCEEQHLSGRSTSVDNGASHQMAEVQEGLWNTSRGVTVTSNGSGTVIAGQSITGGGTINNNMGRGDEGKWRRVGW